MNAKQIGLAVVLADFAAFTAYVVYQYGYVGFFREFLTIAMSNAVIGQLGFDLVITLGLVSLWMWRDARERGVSIIPYLVLTLTLGSIGPLLYLIRRAGSEAAETAHAPARLRHAS